MGGLTFLQTVCVIGLISRGAMMNSAGKLECFPLQYIDARRTHPLSTSTTAITTRTSGDCLLLLYELVKRYICAVDGIEFVE
jgi:hypothetical protein